MTLMPLCPKIYLSFYVYAMVSLKKTITNIIPCKRDICLKKCYLSLNTGLIRMNGFILEASISDVIDRRHKNICGYVKPTINKIPFMCITKSNFLVDPHIKTKRSYISLIEKGSLKKHKHKKAYFNIEDYSMKEMFFEKIYTTDNLYPGFSIYNELIKVNLAITIGKKSS